MTVASVAVAAMKFLFGMYDCTVDSDAGKVDFWLVLEILHGCGPAHVRSHVSQNMDYSRLFCFCVEYKRAQWEWLF